MPTYEYECQQCKKKFNVIQSISEHGTAKVACPISFSASISKRLCNRRLMWPLPG